MFEGRQDGINLGKAVPSVLIGINNSTWRWHSVQIDEAGQTHDARWIVNRRVGAKHLNQSFLK